MATGSCTRGSDATNSILIFSSASTKDCRASSGLKGGEGSRSQAKKTAHKVTARRIRVGERFEKILGIISWVQSSLGFKVQSSRFKV
jgi:hypothetical protein